MYAIDSDLSTLAVFSQPKLAVKLVIVMQDWGGERRGEFEVSRPFVMLVVLCGFVYGGCLKDRWISDFSGLLSILVVFP